VKAWFFLSAAFGEIMPISSSFPVRLDALKDMRDYVQERAKGLPLSPKKIYKLQLSVDEIATNIVLYSGLNGEDAEIVIQAKVLEQSLVVQLKDRGIPFDPGHKLELDKAFLSTPAAERHIGGLGIYLAVIGVDKFSYEYQDGFNVNRFEIYFESEACDV
jgi:serine/threonine-protein kinase RsbW